MTVLLALAVLAGCGGGSGGEGEESSGSEGDAAATERIDGILEAIQGFDTEATSTGDLNGYVDVSTGPEAQLELWEGSIPLDFAYQVKEASDSRLVVTTTGPGGTTYTITSTVRPGPAVRSQTTVGCQGGEDLCNADGSVPGYRSPDQEPKLKSDEAIQLVVEAYRQRDPAELGELEEEYELKGSPDEIACGLVTEHRLGIVGGFEECLRLRAERGEPFFRSLKNIGVEPAGLVVAIDGDRAKLTARPGPGTKDIHYRMAREGELWMIESEDDLWRGQ